YITRIVGSIYLPVLHFFFPKLSHSVVILKPLQSLVVPALSSPPYKAISANHHHSCAYSFLQIIIPAVLANLGLYAPLRHSQNQTNHPSWHNSNLRSASALLLG